ncbi:uncharacterized protein LOC106087392 [Stomoxys calcitrans]|uniref:uncharacterized protein LOC106087392 n=1 Tax=Stomoxys calcitrans TaxID=35570 RepID=UPI0027E29F52|nr:uncharacterized protein LOC106087392 [Stomoxys calcitrans]
MISQNNYGFLLAMALLVCGPAEAQLSQYGSYGAVEKFPQMPQNGVKRNNPFGLNGQVSYFPSQNVGAISSPALHSKESVNYVPLHQYQYVSSSPTTPTQMLWTGPPIVVGDDYYYIERNGGQRQQSGNPPSLQTTRRTSKNLALPGYSNHQQVVPPSQFNYGNQVIYHSDVRRHQILTSPEDAFKPLATVGFPMTKEDAQQYQEASEQQQQANFYHSNHREAEPFDILNANLNYLRAVASSADSDDRLANKNEKVDYDEHFKEYLRKNPYRIRPLY